MAKAVKKKRVQSTRELNRLKKWLGEPDADTVIVVALSHAEEEDGLALYGPQVRVLGHRYQSVAPETHEFRGELYAALAAQFAREAQKEKLTGSVGQKIEHTTEQLANDIVNAVGNKLAGWLSGARSG